MQIQVGVIRMIKNCIIYKYGHEFINKWEIVKNSITQSSLESCSKAAKGFTKKRIEALIELAKSEKLLIEEETQKHHEFTISCEFKVPKLLASGISPFVPVNFKIWLRKDSSVVVTFDAGRRLSGVGTTLLSYATTGDPSSIKHIRLEKDAFLRLKDWILSDEEGQIKRITMHNIEKDEVKFKQIVLSSNQLESSSLFNDLLDKTSAIANLSFTTPLLETTSRPLSCRVNYWGGLTIYTPNLLDSELSELIEVLEKLIVSDKNEK